MDQQLKRISLLIRQNQYDKLTADPNMNLSALIRDLIDDHLGEHNIVIAASEELKQTYNSIIGHTGSSDAEIEKYLKIALAELLKDRIEKMKSLQKKMERA